MNIIRNLLVAMAIFCVAVQVKAYHPDDPTLVEEAMTRVGEYLIKNAESATDLDANFLAADKMLEELEQKKFLFPSSRKAALRELLGLQKLMNQCSLDTFEHFDNVKRDARRNYRTSTFALTAQVRHSDNCADEVANNIATTIQTIEPKTLDLVTKYTDLTIKYIRGILPRYSILDLIKSDTLTTTNMHYLEELWGMLLSEAKDDISGDNDNLQTSELCWRYIFKPCETFTDRLAKDVRVWKRIVDLSMKKGNSESHLEPLTIYYRYLICDYIQGQGRRNLATDINKVKPIK